jgi:hypothetical protein
MCGAACFANTVSRTTILSTNRPLFLSADVLNHATLRHICATALHNHATNAAQKIIFETRTQLRHISE